MRLLKLAMIGVGGIVVLLVIASWYFAGQLMRPAHAEIGAAPTWLGAQPVEFASDSGAVIRGWIAGSEDPLATVVLLHSIRADRRNMLGRARFLAEENYQVLLFDFQAHGESTGSHMGFGYLESHDVIAAAAFLRARSPEVPLFVLGSSLGGAAALLADPPIAVDGLVLEAVYPSIDVAVRNRLNMRLGALGEFVAPLLLVQLRWRLGIDPDDLRPMDRASRLDVPAFVISGENDLHTTTADTQSLFNAFDGPKRLWLVPGAAHQYLHSFAGAEYERSVLQFLRRVRRTQAGAAGGDAAGATRQISP